MIQYNNIANVYYSQGHYEKALEHHQKSLEIKIKVVGHVHPDVANSHMGIGNVLDDMGKHEEAIVEHHKALEVFLAVHGQEHRLWPTAFLI